MSCDWWVSAEGDRRGYRCGKWVAFKWGNRYLCGHHAAGWLRQGYRMEKVVR